MMVLKRTFAMIKAIPGWIISFFLREKLFYPFLISSFLLFNLFSIGHRVRFVALGEELKELNKELSVTISLNQRLSGEALQLSALPRIEQIARDSSGMVLSDRNSRIVIALRPESSASGNQVINRAICSIQRRVDDFVLPQEAFVKGY